MLVGSYNAGLVMVSLLMAMLASYTALDMAGRVAAAKGRAASWWLAGGSVAMGIGIWSMHFLGMLAFRLPMTMSYDPTITFLSLLIAIASSLFALWLVCQSKLEWPQLCAGAAIMGAGICSMHYTGMAAMRMTPQIHYNLPMFLLSAAIAAVASGAALWIAFRLRRGAKGVKRLRAGAAVVMGLAIAGMHYAGMAAARFPANGRCTMPGTGVTTGWLALLIILFTGGVLGIALIISVLDLRMEARTAILASSLAEAKEELHFLTLHDGLTKLPNRSLLLDRLAQHIEHARREKCSFSVLYMDLDGFRQVNDAFGHHTGDRLLVEVTRRLRGTARSSDTLARLGGDEFVLLASVCDPTDAVPLAEKLVTAAREPVEVEGRALQISISLGIAICDGRQENPRDVLKDAEAAMYHAKALGRDGYCFFESSMSDDAHKQLRLLQDLRHAEERQELVLHYQPKFSAREGTLVGVEALVRWNHPTRGLLPPNEFIPLAEKTGLIFQIGAWVLDEACRQMSVWGDEGHTEWTVSVNLSALQFNHAGLQQMVRDVLDKHALESRYLMLEITESTAMRDADASLGILRQLDAMGVRISIDDFGTGYSSLLYLKRLPASELKIDRGFVRDLTHDTEDAAIIAAIVALGHALNLQIVAEGVETREQQEFLTRLGCSTLQGFLLGRPLPADQFIEAVRQRELSVA